MCIPMPVVTVLSIISSPREATPSTPSSSLQLMSLLITPMAQTLDAALESACSAAEVVKQMVRTQSADSMRENVLGSVAVTGVSLEGAVKGVYATMRAGDHRGVEVGIDAETTYRDEHLMLHRLKHSGTH